MEKTPKTRNLPGNHTHTPQRSLAPGPNFYHNNDCVAGWTLNVRHFYQLKHHLLPLPSKVRKYVPGSGRHKMLSFQFSRGPFCPHGGWESQIPAAYMSTRFWREVFVSSEFSSSGIGTVLRRIPDFLQQPGQHIYTM